MVVVVVVWWCYGGAMVARISPAHRSDLGWNDLGSGGAHTSAIQTPTIDRLRGEGVTLSNYYTSCVCSPSRGSFLSGRLPLHLG